MFDMPFFPYGATRIVYPALLLALAVACSTAWQRRRSTALSLLGLAAFLLFLENLAVCAAGWLFDFGRAGWGWLGLVLNGGEIALCGLGIAGAILLARELGGPDDAPDEQPLDAPSEDPGRSTQHGQ
jgi:hypothetical protein